MIEAGVGERIVIEDTGRKIRVSSGDQHQIAFERAIAGYAAGAVDARLETVVRAEQRQSRPFGQQLGRRTRNKKLFTVQGEEDFARFQIEEFNAELRLLELRPIGNPPNALRQCGWAGGGALGCDFLFLRCFRGRLLRRFGSRCLRRFRFRDSP